jgi:rhomboid protease GluP
MQKEILKYPLTYAIMLLNVLAYILSSWMSSSVVEMPLETLVDLGALFGPYVVLQEQWWRLGTAMFLHGGMTHILMNMFSLYLVGRGAESYFDTKSYLTLYLLSGLVGGVASLYMHPVSVAIGASGAIFGMFGALAGFFLAHRHQIATHAKAFMKDFAVIIGLNLVIGFSIESVDVSAHVGGLFAGFIGGYLLSLSTKFLWLYGVLMLLLMFAVATTLPAQYANIPF